MNKTFITYNLQEVHEEIELIFRALKNNPNYSQAEYYHAIQHIIHHVNIAWNGRNASENPSEIEVEKWSEYPTDIKLI